MTIGLSVERLLLANSRLHEKLPIFHELKHTFVIHMPDDLSVTQRTTSISERLKATKNETKKHQVQQKFA